MYRVYKNLDNSKSINCHLVSKSFLLTINENSNQERNDNHILNLESIGKFSEDHKFLLHPLKIYKSYETKKKYIICDVIDLDCYTLLHVRHQDMIELPIKVWIANPY